MNKRIQSGLRAVVALAVMGLTIPANAGADEHEMSAASDDVLGPAHYVIKMTPTLAYVDVGAAVGASPGQPYVILREEMGLYVPVAKIRILRVFDSFSIAETYLIEPGETVAMLQRAVPADLWEAASASLDARLKTPTQKSRQATGQRTRSILLLGGIDASKDVDLLYVNDQLSSADGVSGGAIGLRLSKVVAPHWRVALTYRISGEPLAADADVTQLSIELDSHLLLRQAGLAGPYLGLGAGMHQLAWDSSGSLDDTAYKVGFNLYGGVEVPVSGGAWSLILEGGYQRVMDWNDTIDASNLRALVGLGVNF